MGRVRKIIGTLPTPKRLDLHSDEILYITCEPVACFRGSAKGGSRVGERGGGEVEAPQDPPGSALGVGHAR